MGGNGAVVTCQSLELRRVRDAERGRQPPRAAEARIRARCHCPACRERRRTRGSSKTIAPKRLTKEELRDEDPLDVPDVERPRTRGECAGGERPCPFVSCKHHLYLDVNQETGSIKVNFPDLEVWEMKETCSLDVADRGGLTLEEVGEILNLTREAIRLIEVRGILRLRGGIE